MNLNLLKLFDPATQAIFSLLLKETYKWIALQKETYVKHLTKEEKVFYWCKLKDLNKSNTALSKKLSNLENDNLDKLNKLENLVYYKKDLEKDSTLSPKVWNLLTKNSYYHNGRLYNSNIIKYGDYAFIKDEDNNYHILNNTDYYGFY